MPKYLDWYLVELESHLRDRMRTDQIHSIVTEAGQHLTESYAEHLFSGMADDDAQLAALERFGSPSKVAASEMGHFVKHGNPKASAWGIGMVALAAALVPIVVASATIPQAWFYCLIAVAGLILAFATFAYFAGRLLLFPIAVLVLASASITAMVASQRFVMETSLLPAELPEVLKTFDRSSLAIQEDLALLDAAGAYFAGTPNRSKPYALPNQQGYVVPLGVRDVRISAPVGYIVVTPRLSRGSVLDWNDARKRWMEASSNAYTKSRLNHSLGYLATEKNRLTSFHSQFPADVFSERMTESMAYGGIAIIGLWAINLIAVGLGKLGRRRRTGDWLEKRLA